MKCDLTSHFIWAKEWMWNPIEWFRLLRQVAYPPPPTLFSFYPQGVKVSAGKGWIPIITVKYPLSVSLPRARWVICIHCDDPLRKLVCVRVWLQKQVALGWCLALCALKTGKVMEKCAVIKSSVENYRLCKHVSMSAKLKGCMFKSVWCLNMSFKTEHVQMYIHLYI